MRTPRSPGRMVRSGGWEKRQHWGWRTAAGYGDAPHSIGAGVRGCVAGRRGAISTEERGRTSCSITRVGFQGDESQ